MSATRLQQLLEFLKENPKDSFLRYALALEYIKYHRFTEAMQCLEDLLADDPHYLGAYYQLAKLYETDNVEKAQATYEKGIQIATLQKDAHTLSELRSAYEMLLL